MTAAITHTYRVYQGKDKPIRIIEVKVELDQNDCFDPDTDAPAAEMLWYVEVLDDGRRIPHSGFVNRADAVAELRTHTTTEMVNFCNRN